jgi:hypothetical protein
MAHLTASNPEQSCAAVLLFLLNAARCVLVMLLRGAAADR